MLLLAGLLLFAFVKLSHQSPSSSNSYSGNARQLAANSLELATGKDAVTTRSPSGEMPATRGVTWINGDPTFKDGTTTVRLAPSLIVIEEGSTSARFYINPHGTGIILVPPPDARSRETYNTQTHQYVNTSPRNGDATGNYPNGPPPTMMTKLAPFAQVAMKAIDQVKQTPRGAKWDDQYFREILKPYDTSPASNPR